MPFRTNVRPLDIFLHWSRTHTVFSRPHVLPTISFIGLRYCHDRSYRSTFDPPFWVSFRINSLVFPGFLKPRITPSEIIAKAIRKPVVRWEKPNGDTNNLQS